ncbi:hypothetical protein Pmani_027066 [Petrolisthes manimaculis]|uniref:Uncharacterized protein n=1 Tax=Petrolisthes manimaculis TaxID=1843537 RepID=A0AAE1P4Y5_9EUCA|nr:hypothetical protein Pmani_027066 [Petrolisthes manimaculis]
MTTCTTHCTLSIHPRHNTHQHTHRLHLLSYHTSTQLGVLLPLPVPLLVYITMDSEDEDGPAMPRTDTYYVQLIDPKGSRQNITPHIRSQDAVLQH